MAGSTTEGTCPVLAFDAWQAVAKRRAGPLFRKISTAGRIGDAALHPDAVRRILARRIAMAGITVDGFDRLSAHALRVGFITAAYDKGVRDEDIMRHTRHRDLRTMRGYVQRAGLVSESPAGMRPISDVRAPLSRRAGLAVGEPGPHQPPAPGGDRPARPRPAGSALHVAAVTARLSHAGHGRHRG
jgi:hypothetical protein